MRNEGRWLIVTAAEPCSDFAVRVTAFSAGQYRARPGEEPSCPLAGPTKCSAATDAEAARRFIVGKLFTFTCAAGSRGVARVYGDGSGIGTIQFHGSEQPRPVWLPAETLKLTGETVCASLNRTELCFALSKTSDQSFRASVTGLDFAYCDFTERVRTPDTVPRPESSEPLSLDPPRDGAVH